MFGDVADGMQRVSANLARSLRDVVGHGEDLCGLFVEEQVIVAEVPAGYVRRGSLKLPPVETTKANSLAAGIEAGRLYHRRCGIFRPLTIVKRAHFFLGLHHPTTAAVHLPASQERGRKSSRSTRTDGCS